MLEPGREGPFFGHPGAAVVVGCAALPGSLVRDWSRLPASHSAMVAGNGRRQGGNRDEYMSPEILVTAGGKLGDGGLQREEYVGKDTLCGVSFASVSEWLLIRLYKAVDIF